MKIKATWIILTTLLLAIAASGCTDQPDYKQVDYTSLLSKSSEYNGTQVCLKGEISDTRLGEKIRLEGDELAQYKDRGVYAQVCGVFTDQDGVYTLRPEHIKPLVTITTDRHTYHSKDRLQVEVTIFADNKESQVPVTVSGITNSFGREMIKETREVSLKQGENKLSFNFTTPDCEECAGLEPGLYFIKASVLIDDELRTASTQIMLQKGKETP